MLEVRDIGINENTREWVKMLYDEIIHIKIIKQ